MKAKKAAKPKKDVKETEVRDVREHMIDILAKAEHCGDLTVRFVIDQIQEHHKKALTFLKKKKIDPLLITPGIVQAALNRQRQAWRNSMIEANARPDKVLTVVLLGDPELDPAMHIKPLEASGAPYPTQTRESVPNVPDGPKEPIPDLDIPEPGEKAERVAEEMETFLLRDDEPKEKKPKEEKARGQKLFGFSLTSVLRWVGNKFKKLDQEVVEKKAVKLLKHFGLKAESNTVACQVRAGRNGKNHYGPMPKLSKDIAEAIVEILDKK